MPARTDTTRDLDWAKLIETALTAPGNVGDVYSRFYSYSFLNCIHLAMQGAEGPVATFQRWKTLGRHVLKGSKAFEIVRPITVKREAADGEELLIKRFKPVRCLFGYNQTDGEPLPPAPEPPKWSLDRAIDKLEITRKPYTAMDGNLGGYSWDRNFAVNPVAPYPFKTSIHEISHIEAGHTTSAHNEEYRLHRGRYEFEAEGSAHLVMHELGMMTEEQATVSRGYLQSWMAGEAPPESSIRKVFKVTDTILRAGRLALDGGDGAEA